MADILVPPEAVTVAHDILWGGQMSEALVRRALEVAAPYIRAIHPDGLDPAELAATLAAMIADLDGYITRKAEAIAAPVIAAAEEAAIAPAGEARADAQRWKDVCEELRRRIAPLERMQAETREARNALARALGREPALTQMPGLVAAAVQAIQRDRLANPALTPIGTDLDLLCMAADLACRAQQVSPVLIQRKVHVGFAKAARLFDLLADYGVIGPRDNRGQAPVLVTEQDRDFTLTRLREAASKETTL